MPSPDLGAHLVDPVLGEQLDNRYDAIAAEHAAAVERIAAVPDPTSTPDLEFTRHLKQRPDDDALSAEWNRTTAEIAAYRDRYQVTDTTSIAGDRPENRAEHAPYNTVHTGIDTLHEHIEQQ